MKGKSWGAALTGGLAAAAMGLVVLLGTVLRLSAAPVASTGITLRDSSGRPEPTRAPGRELAPEKPSHDRRPPVRLWRGPTPERAKPHRARKALA